MLYGCQKGTSARFIRAPPAAEKQLTFLHVLQVWMHQIKELQVRSFNSIFHWNSTAKLALLSTLKGYVFSNPYEQLSVDTGGQIGFGLGNNWFAFGDGPDLGFLPLDDYHLVAIIIKLAKAKKKMIPKVWDEFTKAKKWV